MCYLPYFTFRKTCRKSFHNKMQMSPICVVNYSNYSSLYTRAEKGTDYEVESTEGVEEWKANWRAEEEHKICRMYWWENEFPTTFQHGTVQYIMICTSWPLMQCICFVSQTWPVKSYLAITTCQSTAHQLFDIKYWFKMTIHQKPETMY